jgi:hypothetical protein
VVGDPVIPGAHPLHAIAGLAGIALAEERQIHHDIGASVGTHSRFRHAHRCQQIGLRGDVLTCGHVARVHKVTADDERA